MTKKTNLNYEKLKRNLGARWFKEFITLKNMLENKESMKIIAWLRRR
jgi:hypothetical protein